MRRLHLSILQELGRLETQKEREEAIREILNLLEDITDGKLLSEEGENSGKGKVNPFEGLILWRADEQAI